MVAPMTSVAFVLVFGSAFCHASWNFRMKRSDHKVAFLGSFAAVAFVAFLAPTAVAVFLAGLSSKGVTFGLGTAALHGVYGLTLARGYQLGDLSAVYPISRGMGPALIPLGAVLLLDEHTSIAAGIGIALVVFGIYVIHVEGRDLRGLTQPLRSLGRPATRIAVVTGTLIATYSLWDKAGLDDLWPLVLLPVAMLTASGAVQGEWRERAPSVVAAGVLAPLAYVLVLVALTTSRISYVAPAREAGIGGGAMLGGLLLGGGAGAWGGRGVAAGEGREGRGSRRQACSPPLV